MDLAADVAVEVSSTGVSIRARRQIHVYQPRDILFSNESTLTVELCVFFCSVPTQETMRDMPGLLCFDVTIIL